MKHVAFKLMLLGVLFFKLAIVVKINYNFQELKSWESATQIRENKKKFTT